MKNSLRFRVLLDISCTQVEKKKNKKKIKVDIKIDNVEWLFELDFKALV